MDPAGRLHLVRGVDARLEQIDACRFGQSDATRARLECDDHDLGLAVALLELTNILVPLVHRRAAAQQIHAVAFSLEPVGDLSVCMPVLGEDHGVEIGLGALQLLQVLQRLLRVAKREREEAAGEERGAVLPMLRDELSEARSLLYGQLR